jgi:hypothetical protein
MLGRLAIFLSALSFGLMPASALASSQDVASTHAYLTASYKVLHTTVSTWPKVEANIHKLDLKLGTECPKVAANSPQNEPSQKLTYEVAGAIWSTAYHTNTKLVQKFARTVQSLHWSNSAITRSDRAYATSLHELTVLPLPNLCGDVRTWGSGGFKAIPTSTLQFDRHVEAIEGKAVSLRLLAPYESSADRSLAARVARLETRFEHLETERGFEDWNTLLETLGLNQ